MTRILGIDPGSRVTGYGVVEHRGATTRFVACGCIEPRDGPLPQRLRDIYAGVLEVIDEHAPDELAIEQVFMARNADSALKLGHARGAAIVAAANRGLPVSEYTPRQIKLAVTGSGGADKTQIQHMIRVLLKLPTAPRTDAADALGVALCHAHTRGTLAHLPVAGLRVRSGRAR